MDANNTMPVPVYKPPTLTEVILERMRSCASLDEVKECYRFLREVQTDEARVAAAADFVLMQADLPEITKHGKAHNYAYARWEDINAQIKPVLSAHGFALNFKIHEEGEQTLAMTAILKHRDGHVEQTTKRLPLDKSGSKNIVQAFGSTQSYAMRYAAIALLNIVSRGEDDDAGGASSDTIDGEQAQELRNLLDEAGLHITTFCKAMNIRMAVDLPVARMQEARDRIAGFKAKREAANAAR